MKENTNKNIITINASDVKIDNPLTVKGNLSVANSLSATPNQTTITSQAVTVTGETSIANHLDVGGSLSVGGTTAFNNNVTINHKNILKTTFKRFSGDIIPCFGAVVPSHKIKREVVTLQVIYRPKTLRRYVFVCRYCDQYSHQPVCPPTVAVSLLNTEVSHLKPTSISALTANIFCWNRLMVLLLPSTSVASDE